MKILYDITTNFKNYEYDTNTKILINVCDLYDCTISDSNFFYNRYYCKIKNDFNLQKHKLGNITFCDIFTYHKICNMFCIEWPKSQYNLKPFKMNYFQKCCEKLKDYIIENDIRTIISPKFGLEILEGNWGDILSVMNNIFPNSITYTIIR